MPNLKASIKDVRRTKSRKAANTVRKENAKKAVKAFIAVAKADQAKALELLPLAYKAIDKNAKNHVIHPNTAARKKAQLAKMVATK